MDRRDLLRLIPTGTGPGLCGLLAGRKLGGAEATGKAIHAYGMPPLKITDIRTILTAPDRIRLVVVKVMTSEPGLYGLGLCDVYPAGPRRADCRRQVPQALPHRPRPRRDRGHLAVVLRQLLLAERPGPVQCHERRGHGALGYQGQAGQHAGLSASGGQVPVRCGLLYSHQRARLHEVEDRARAAMEKGTSTFASRWASPAWPPTALGEASAPWVEPGSVGPTNPRGDLGAQPLRPRDPEAVRAPAGQAG